jgi:hypothetical protein
MKIVVIGATRHRRALLPAVLVEQPAELILWRATARKSEKIATDCACAAHRR